MAKKITAVIIIAFWTIFCQIASAQPKYLMDGNMLYDRLNHTSTSANLHAMGYIAGVVDMAKFEGTEYFQCLPIGVRNDQMGDIVKKFLERNPEYRHEPAMVSVVLALGTNFPCQ